MNTLFIFGLGAAAGSLLTWKLVEKKYKDLADEEIASVIEHFKHAEPKAEIIVEDKSEIFNSIKVVKSTYEHTLDELGYTIDKDDNVIVSEDKDGSIYIEPGIDYVKPYVITPEEFGELDYNTHCWTLYSDLVITDEHGNIVMNPEEFVGDALTHVGQYEDDSVHVRNENIEADYEIIKIEESFSAMNNMEADDLRGIDNDAIPRS